MWDARYAGPEYLFGKEPAAFVLREVERLAPASKVLALADGEGRNSVYLARQGHHVTAMDSSGVAVEKARALARSARVAVDFQVADIAAWDWRAEEYDAVLAVFIQFAEPPLREMIFAGIRRTLRPGGLLLLHGYAPRQVGYGTGGPGRKENLYTLDLLRAQFAGLDELQAADYDAEIQEGAGHSGNSALIDFVARKPDWPDAG